MNGWIKLYRSLLNKPLWKESTPEQCKILITILLKANHEEKQWRWKDEKITLKPGQFITSLWNIAEECGKGITIQKTRTALKKFERYGFLTNKSTSTGSLITIVNWEFYQLDKDNVNKGLNKEVTKMQQSLNKELTTNKKYKEIKNIYIGIFNHWNSKGIVKHRKLSKNIEKAMDLALKLYSKNEIIKAIDRYSTIYFDKDYYYDYTWTLEKFLKQSNGIFNYTDEGIMWINYKKSKESSNIDFIENHREKYIVV